MKDIKCALLLKNTLNKDQLVIDFFFKYLEPTTRSELLDLYIKLLIYLGWCARSVSIVIAKS